MDIGKNKLKSIIKHVQNSAEGLANKNIPKKLDRSSSITSSSTASINTKLDLPSAIEYNYCLINSYLQERNQRKLSPHEEILKTLVDEEHDEDFIINSISKEFFLDPNSLEEHNNNNNNSNTDNESNSNNCDVLYDKTDINGENDHLDGQSKIIEMCVLNKLPEFSEAAPHLGDEFLNYLENEKKKLNRQQTIVSKKLTELILINDGQFKSELERVRLIENDLSTAVQICSNGRQSFRMSKKNFTETSINIIENYRLREEIIKIIECLQNIKKLRQTIEHIEYMLQYEKNFSGAINLFDEKFEILETMSKKYLCVAKMKEKLVQTLQLVDDQMDTVLAKMTERFCLETFGQLCKAYSQIDKSESSINQLLLHFHNAIHDKAFSIVLGYVKLFTPEDHLVLLSTTTTGIGSANASSTPIKNSNKNKIAELNNQQQLESNNLKRKPFNELCQYLNPESFLQCLTDLCRALWDIMNNYHQILCFFQKEDLRCAANLTKNEIKFAIDKLTYGVLRVWSDVQHKIRTLVSSVKFVQSLNDDSSAINDLVADQQNQQSPHHNQDQLLFSFEEFIKILTVCERMIEIGEQFCDLYYNRKNNGESFDSANNNDDDGGAAAIDSTIEFQQTLYQQTRAYFQSYHQVSMCELKIFLENEIWTRCPIDTNDEFELIANLQEFAFIKNRLLKVKSTSEADSPSKARKDSNKSANNNTKPITSPSYLLSPVTKAKKYFNISYFQQPDDVNIENVKVDRSITSPFDGIITRIVSQQTFDDSDFDDDDVDADKDQEDSKYINHNQSSLNNNLEIVTTNTTLNVLRLVGRYMNIMFLLRPISHDIIKALLELFDYYFYTVYHFYAMDLLNVSWLMNGIFDQHSNHYQNNNNLADKISSSSTTTAANTNYNNNKLLLNHFSSFIRRINDTLILNNNDQSSPTHHLTRIIVNNNNNNNDSPSKRLSPKAANIKYPCPNLPEYVSIESPSNNYALGERIIAIQSLIFITRQFYNLCPFLLEFLRFDDDQQQQQYDSISQQKQNIWSDRRKSAEDGFKLLQFYYDKMCSSVESLQFQCLYAVSSKLLPYEMIIQQMSQIKWDLKEIPSIHSSYVNVFIKHLYEFDPLYRNLLESYDLQFLKPDSDENNYKQQQQQLSGTATNNRNEDTSTSDLDDEMPLIKLLTLSQRMNIILWQCILKISNRTFIEGFSTAKKCTNEGRALMQLDYEQFLSHIEKLLMPYFKKAFAISDSMNFSSSSSGDNNNYNPNNLTIKTILKSYLANERLYVEEYVKAYYITESAFVEWIKQRPDYTTKQIVSLINCITVDNKKLRSSLLAAIETMPSSSNTIAISSTMIDQNHSTSTTTIANNNVNHFN